MKYLISLLVCCALIYVIIGISLYAFQRSFIYYPVPAVAHGYEELVTQAADGAEVRTIRLNPGREHAVLYFGGNAESVSFSAEDYASALPSTTLYLVNYRGFNGSSGRATESNLFTDAENIYDQIKHQHKTISVIGRSLGSGVACWLAKQRSVNRLVLVTPFDSILQIAQASYPIYPLQWLLKDQYNSVEYASDIEIPVMVLLAERDQVIPMDSSQRLMQGFPTMPVHRVLASTDHNSIHLHSDFYASITEFLE